MKYELAIVANPYTKLSWNGLQQWGTLTHTAMSSPPIVRPTIELTRPAGSPPQAKVTMPKGLTAEAAEDVAVWTAYAKCRVNGDVARPANQRRTVDAGDQVSAGGRGSGDGGYRRWQGDAGDADTCCAGVTDAFERQVLACWVLLNGGDHEVTQDYAAYREWHKDLLIAYLEKYVIHASAAPTT